MPVCFVECFIAMRMMKDHHLVRPYALIEE
jgi:hypothetical protein